VKSCYDFAHNYNQAENGCLKGIDAGAI